MKVILAGTSGNYTEHEVPEGTTVGQLLELTNQPTTGINLTLDERTVLDLNQELQEDSILCMSPKSGGN